LPGAREKVKADVTQENEQLRTQDEERRAGASKDSEKVTKEGGRGSSTRVMPASGSMTKTDYTENQRQLRGGQLVQKRTGGEGTAKRRLEVGPGVANRKFTWVNGLV